MEDIIILGADNRETWKPTDRTVIKLSRDEDERTDDPATRHLEYIASGKQDADDEQRIKYIFTHKSVAEQARNEQERGK